MIVVFRYTGLTVQDLRDQKDISEYLVEPIGEGTQ